MAVKERNQNPVIGDELRLRLFGYNCAAPVDVHEVEKVEVYFLDKNEISDTNVEGRRLVETFEGTDVIHEETGQYSLNFNVEDIKYTIGKYRDVWTVKPREQLPTHQLENLFEIKPDLWYFTTNPVVYGFQFTARPNRFRQGSRQWIMIDVVPNVPRGSDLERYYENLLIASPLKISIEQACVDCMPAESDLRLLVEKDSVDYREGCRGFYLFDTEDLDCGIYNVWVEMDFGETRHISEKMQVEVFT